MSLLKQYKRPAAPDVEPSDALIEDSAPPPAEKAPADAVGLVRVYRADARNVVVERRSSRSGQWKNDGYYATARAAVVCALEESVRGETVDEVLRSVRTALSSMEANKPPCHGSGAA